MGSATAIGELWVRCSGVSPSWGVARTWLRIRVELIEGAAAERCERARLTEAEAPQRRRFRRATVLGRFGALVQRARLVHGSAALPRSRQLSQPPTGVDEVAQR